MISDLSTTGLHGGRVVFDCLIVSSSYHGVPQWTHNKAIVDISAKRGSLLE